MANCLLNVYHDTLLHESVVLPMPLCGNSISSVCIAGISSIYAIEQRTTAAKSVAVPGTFRCIAIDIIAFMGVACESVYAQGSTPTHLIPADSVT